MRDLRKKGRNKGGKICNLFQLSEQQAVDESINNLSSRKTYYDSLFMRKSQTEKTRQTRKGRKKKDALQQEGPQGSSRKV